ncbi:hypothetical protein Glove_735g4 [Diversispora epigaea]|uniref:Uncharacterized protein n=1 Tax=Diversispora epigaea TaxID=1348612 RepID=A0A397G466_9GLOM|nr:hypothetical protein Glove_735g4 [Diversispora epigaea]
MSLGIPLIVIPDCSLQQFEKIADENPSFFCEEEMMIITEVCIWCKRNVNLVGRRSYRLLDLEDSNYDKPTVLIPNISVVLKTRWDTLTDEEKEVRVYTINDNNINWNTYKNPAQVASQILPGFVLNMEEIY